MNILLVDDEPAVISTVSYIVKNKCKIDGNVYTAYNAIEAMQVIKELRIDLVITDVRLGNDNGLELAKEIIDFCPSCSIVVLSAHDRKDYLKAALSMNVLRYIQKPIRAAEIIEVVELVSARLKLEEKKKVSMQSSYMDDKLIDILVSKKYQSDEKRILVQDFGNKEFLYCKNYVSIIIKVSEINKKVDILNLIHSMSANMELICIGKKKNESVYIFLVATDIDDLLFTVEHLMKCIFIDGLSEEAHICIGNIVKDYKDIHSSYTNACSALEHAFYIGKGVHIYDENSEADGKTKSDVSAAFNLSAIPKDEDGFISYLKNIYENLKLNASIPSGTVRLLFLNIINYMIMTSQKDNIGTLLDMNEINHKEFLSLDEAYEFTKKTIIENGLFTESDHLAYRVKDYIKQNYNDQQLCVEVLAEYFYVSTTHLTRLFRKTFDVSVGQYIINVRISAAKKMLDLYDSDIRTVADAVGYSDPNYFSRIFKQKTGMTVSEYKKKEQ